MRDSRLSDLPGLAADVEQLLEGLDGGDGAHGLHLAGHLKRLLRLPRARARLQDDVEQRRVRNEALRKERSRFKILRVNGIWLAFTRICSLPEGMSGTQWRKSEGVQRFAGRRQLFSLHCCLLSG